MRIARTMVTNTLQNTAREKKERKKSISGFFAKKKNLPQMILSNLKSDVWKNFQQLCCLKEG
jgi:hypothetical protein